MVQRQTILNVVDNSGVKQIKCIEVLGRGRRGVGYQGDLIVASVVSVNKKSMSQKMKHKNSSSSSITWKKGSIVRALILGTKKCNSLNQGFKNKVGISVGFPAQNTAVLVTGNTTKKIKEPLGSRIIGPLPSSLRRKGFTKVMFIGGKVVL